MIIPSIDVAGTPAAWTMEALILVATSGGATMFARVRAPSQHIARDR
jgi:hypothetical protein